MNKKGAFLAVLLAGAMSFGVVANAGCKNHGDGHVHTWSTKYYSDGAEGHHRVSTCLDHATVNENVTDHVYDDENDATCNLCDYVRDLGGDVAVTSVAISGENSVQEGKTIQLTAAVLPANATNRTVTWSITAGNNFATIDQTGLLTATAQGSVTVQASAGGVTDTKTITVTARPAGDIRVTGVSLDKTSAPLSVGGSLTLNPTITPATATDKNVSWRSSDDSVATVDSNGVVRAVKSGSVTITVTTSDGGKQATCLVTVTGGAVNPPEPGEQYTVKFMSDGKVVEEMLVNSGNCVAAPITTKDGYYFKGWYENESGTGSPFNAATPVTANKTYYAVWEQRDTRITYSQAAKEKAAFEWVDSNPEGAKVEYRLTGESAYTVVDEELVRATDDQTARVDIVGLKGGAEYDFKITTSANDELTVNGMRVNSYDRSGYAHFNYNQGVGAYNDDGTLKDNALVIYVTEENKDTVMKEVCEENPDVPMFKIPYCTQSGVVGKNWDKNADGIGWWLNNNQYTANNAASSKNKAPSNTYDATNGSKLAFKAVDRPIVIRFIGTVTTPEGCTAYDTTAEGGGVGDNGHMARMKNLKNVTLEGIGSDAEIKGWGFHFVAGTDAVNGQGTSFEVRNLKFNEYPEDAIGMEGQQSGTTITAGVERCWIHNNTFLPGRCDNPAESDKAEGDGSCDFKRGQYFTCSYNWFEYCHKTNLIGSSDSSLQYNMTYHHNVWWQCGSRIPLTRQANVHFYNNYVYGDFTETSTPYTHISKPSLSYVHSLRANCYLFSEGNYYDGMKQVTDGKSGGAGKAWNNMYYSCFGTNTLVEATSREQKVSNNCKYGSTDYSSFDTNPTQFYYDAQNKKSNCYITDAATARAECLKFSGVQKRTYDINTSMVSSANRPASALNVPQDGLTVDLTKATVGGTVSGVKFINAKNSSGAAKGKGMLAVFTLSDRTDITLSGGTSGDTALELVREDGYVIAGKLTSFTGTLEAGTYVIAAGQKDKEGSITALSFKSGVTDAEKVQNVINYISEIGTVEYSEACKAKIDRAQAAYNALATALKAQVTNADTLTAAITEYNKFAANPVIALIADIGTVDENSGIKISKARAAYDLLTSAQQQLVTNYEALVAAEKAYEAYEVQGLKNQIAALAAPSTATTEAQISALLEDYRAIRIMYYDLGEEQQTQITEAERKKVTDGIAALEAAYLPYELRDMIADLPEAANVTLAHASKVSEIRAKYDALTAGQKTAVGDITKLTAAEAKIEELASQTKVAIFDKSKPNLATEAGFTITGSANYKGTDQKFTYNGTEYSAPLKIQSGNTITFTTATDMTLTLYLHSGGAQTIKVDGTTYTATNGYVTVSISAGNHVIGREKEAWLCYAELSPAK